MCMWDIIGKWLNVPVYSLFGGPTRDRIPVYAHVCPEGEGQRHERLARGAKLMVEHGYKAVKIDPYGRDYRAGVSDPHFPSYIKEASKRHPARRRARTVPVDVYRRSGSAGECRWTDSCFAGAANAGLRRRAA